MHPEAENINPRVESDAAALMPVDGEAQGFVDPKAPTDVMSPEQMQRTLRRHDAIRRNLNGRSNDRLMRAGAPKPKLESKRWTLSWLLACQADIAARNAAGEIIPGQREGRRRIRLAIARTKRAIAKCDLALAKRHHHGGTSA